MGAEFSQLNKLDTKLSQLTNLKLCTGKPIDLLPKQNQQPSLHCSASLKFDEEAKLNHYRNNINLSPSQSTSYISDDTLCAASSPSQSRTLSAPKQRCLNIQLPQSFTTSADHQLEQVIVGDAASKKYHAKCHKVHRKQQQFEYEAQLQQKEHNHHPINLDNAFALATFEKEKGGPIYDILSDSHRSSSPVTPITTNWCATSPTVGAQSYSAATASMTAISSCYKGSDHESSDYNEEEEDYLYSSDDDAHSVDNCVAIKRIIDALKWYAKHGDDHELVYEKMAHNLYGKQILNDYSHIMDCHLEKNGKMHKMKYIKDYKLICDEVDKYVDACSDSADCVGYRRYLRWKHCKNVHRASTQKQYEIQTYINTLDGIHCCFLHVAKQAQFK